MNHNFYRYSRPNRSKSAADSLQSKKEEGATIQPKLTIGKPNDQYEQEADRVANKVVNNPTPSIQTKPEEGIANGITPLVQRAEEDEMQQKPEVVQKAGEEDEMQPKLESIQREGVEDEMQTKSETVQRQGEEDEMQPKSENTRPAKSAPAWVSRQVKASRGSGTPLPGPTKKFMESRFGTDFSGVRIHTDSSASQMNKSIQAKAFTVGNDIYFSKGRFSPESASGKELLAHELTHTIQQGASGSKKKS